MTDPTRPDPTAVAETAARLTRLYSAIVYDVMDELGLPHQCLDLGIRPLDAHMSVAGPAYTVVAGPDVRAREEQPTDSRTAHFAVFDHIYPGCVVVLGAAGETRSGVWGELLSNASAVKGATGVVIDGGIRDSPLVLDIDGYAAFARYCSPIESLGRARMHDYEVPVSMTGTLTSQVRVNPGDWIYGDCDGVLVIPADRLEEVLTLSEHAKEVEDRVRADVRAGRSLGEVFDTYGRL